MTEPERRWRRAMVVAITITAAGAAANLYAAFTYGGLLNGILSPVLLGACIGLVWLRRRALRPFVPWAEITVNGKRVARFPTVVLPPGHTLELGLHCVTTEDDSLVVIGIEAVTVVGHPEPEN